MKLVLHLKYDYKKKKKQVINNPLDKKVKHSEGGSFSNNTDFYYSYIVVL
jgi:hypothetical protein